jgi:spoIIIJ-associated protein
MEEKKNKIKETIKKLAEYMNVSCEVEIKEEVNDKNTVLLVSVYTPENARFLIGKNGQNIKALEHLLRAMLIKEKDILFNLTLDINDYKRSKTAQLIEVAKLAVGRVRNTQRAEALEPMSPYERRIVHMELASFPDITTESIGEEPYRRIVVKPYL